MFMKFGLAMKIAPLLSLIAAGIVLAPD